MYCFALWIGMFDVAIQGSMAGEGDVVSSLGVDVKNMGCRI